jgi:hypothetical protein
MRTNSYIHISCLSIKDLEAPLGPVTRVFHIHTYIYIYISLVSSERNLSFQFEYKDLELLLDGASFG